MMRKILASGKWFTPKASSSMYENDYENRLIRYKDKLFPDYYCAKYKTKIDSDFGNCIPDLILIHKSYKDWYIVEVELEHHSLQSHVYDQITKMHHGYYDREHLISAKFAIPELELPKLEELIRQRPKTLVIVPVSKITWREALFPYKTKIMSVEVWEDDTGEAILHIEGDRPTTYEDEFVSELRTDSALPRTLKVMNTAALPREGVIQINYLGSRESWTIMTTSAGKWLIPKGRSTLPSGVFSLKLSESESYLMEEKSGF